MMKTPHKRGRWVAANWKLNKTPKESAKFITKILPVLSWLHCRVVLFPQNFSCSVVGDLAAQTDFFWGAQNIYKESSGAFTGENSPEILSKMGALFVLLGHSERRRYFGETNAEVSAKILAAQKFNLTPVVCVGESLEQRKSGAAQACVQEQVQEIVWPLCQQKASGEEGVCKTIFFAYEPLWAIGTGHVASPSQVQKAHVWIREKVKEMCGEPFAQQMPILYGGSVKPENANDLWTPDTDGFLVGGASLQIDSFLSIARSA